MYAELANLRALGRAAGTAGHRTRFGLAGWEPGYSGACAWGSPIISAGPWLSRHRPGT